MAKNDFTLDKFYTDPSLNINSEHYSVVLGFFKKVTDNEKSAEAFALDLFRIAKTTNVNVLTLLESMNDKDKMGVNEIMCYYLNQIRSQSALLGVSNIITANQNVARNIVQ
jgi:hypothetical protein